jgi:type IV secretory pathway ATPase VirB11/archaellum biosynthesis ATPase/intein/homing endonuclease
LKFRLPFPRKKEKVAVEELAFRVEPLVAAFQGEVLAKYPIEQAVVFVGDRDGRGLYMVSEPELTPEEQRLYSLLMESLYYSLRPAAKIEDPMRYVESFIWESAEDLGVVEQVQKSFQKLKYYVSRDAFGYGLLHVPMMDPGVEEISVTSYAAPVNVIHRNYTQYDWLETNIVFGSEDNLRNYVQRLAQRTGKSVTVAIPFCDAMSREGHRIAVTFADEVTLPGSTLSVRKFPEQPFSMGHLLKFKTLTPLMAAYLWILAEYKGFILTLGAMSSGKSVAGDEHVLAVLNDVPVCLTFNDLWERTSGTTVENNGVTFKNPSGILVPALASGSCGFVKPRLFIRHAFTGTGAKITLKDGREVVATLDHSLVVLSRNGEIVVKTPGDLQEGDMLPVPAKIRIPEGKLTLPELLSVLAESRLYVETQSVDEAVKNLSEKFGSKKAVAAAMGLNSASCLSQRRIPLKNALRAWLESGSIPADVEVSDGKGFCKFKVLETVLDPRFAKLMGYYIAVGHLDRGRCVVSVGNLEGLKDVAEAAESLRFRPYLFKPKHRAAGVVLPVAASAVIQCMGCGWDGGSKKLPNIYWGMPREWKRQLLRAYFGSDGGVESFGSVRFTTKSFALSRHMMLALLEFGIHATRRVKRVGETCYYEVTVPSYFTREFAENIGLSQPSKSLKLEALMKRKRPVCSRFHVVPNCLLKRSMDEVRELAKSYKFFDRNVYKGYAVSKKNLLRRLMQADPERRLSKLWSLAESDVIWVPVKRVEKTHIDGYVYDFSTSSETFMAGDGVIVHNTTFTNCLLTMIDPVMKIATIEDTSELQIPHKSWQRFKARHTYSITEARFDVDLMDLVKLSLRYRPDYITVGEVRGEEIRALVQAAALGHGCLATIHAESPEAALIRMKSPPMDVPEGNLMLIWCFPLLGRVRMPDGSVVRRVLEATEVEPKEGRIELRRVFTWNARDDSFAPEDAEAVVKRSYRLGSVKRLTGWSDRELSEELNRRAEFLEGVVDAGKLSYSEFTESIGRFYTARRKGFK